MTNHDDVISLIEGKLSRVIQFAERLISENEDLRRQVGELSGQLQSKDHEVEVLESKYQDLKVTRILTSSSKDVKEVKLQVNRMVREIDKCIALLNR